MKTVLINLLFFFIFAILIFIFDYVFVLKRKLKSKKFKNEEIMEISYLINKFNLDTNKVLYKPMCLYCALFNGFIISGVGTVIHNIKLNYGFRFLIGFVLLFGLIYSVYEIYGRILIKKGWQRKDV